jgi:uncharacterized protein (UPF0276 family)
VTPAELGVGLVYFQALAPLAEERGALDVLEVEPQVFWLPSEGPDRYRDSGAPLRWLAGLPVPKIAHGVASPIGSARPPDAAAVDRFARDLVTLQAAWASEHLSFSRARGADGPFEAGFFLPPRQTREAALRIARNARAMAARLPVPFAVETGVNYLKPLPGELSDGRFVATVAEEADCGILLDLHNVWTNARNGRQPLDEFLRELPLERVVEVHVAGGEWHRGYWLDAHNGPAQGELMDIVRRVLPELPSLRALIFEMLADHVPRVGFDAIRGQIAELRRAWDARLAAPARARRAAWRWSRQTDDAPGSADAGADDAAQWEDALGALAVGREASGPLAPVLAADPAIPIFRDLVDAQRAGSAVDSLKLTTRLMRLALGSDGLMAELRAFWASATPSLFGADEGAALGAFLAGRDLPIAHLTEVLAFERALLRIHRGSAGEAVRFSCDPAALLGALSEHRLPPELPPADVELRLSPDGSISVGTA